MKKNLWSVSALFGVMGLASVAPVQRILASETCPSTATYTFLKGDTLSQVLRVVGRTPLWGENGRVARLVKEYPHAFSKLNFGHALAGAQVVLPVEFCPRFSGWKIVDGKIKRVASEEAPVQDSSPAAPAPKAALTPAPTSAPTPEPTPLPETDVHRSLQSGDSGYTKMLDNLSGSESTSED
jgi:hypothetical protein